MIVISVSDLKHGMSIFFRKALGGICNQENLE